MPFNPALFSVTPQIPPGKTPGKKAQLSWAFSNRNTDTFAYNPGLEVNRT